MTTRSTRIFLTHFLVAGTIIVCGCKKDCGDEEGAVTGDERTWIPYTAGQQIVFTDQGGTTDTLVAGNVLDRKMNGGGSKEETCRHDFHYLEQPLSGLVGWSIIVVHRRPEDTSDQYGFGSYGPISHFNTGSPHNGVVVQGVSYDGVYIIQDSAYYFSKAQGFLRITSEGTVWEKVP